MDNVKFHTKLIKKGKYCKDELKNRLFEYNYSNSFNIFEVAPESQRHYSYPREEKDLTVKYSAS